LTILEKGTNGTIYNIGTTNEYSVNELYDILRGIINPCATKVHVGDRPHNDKRYAIDTTLLHALGWREETRFEDALQRTVEWYRDHPEWYA
jgi:dTDP-glucose 4,6-dehydratase